MFILKKLIIWYKIKNTQFFNKDEEFRYYNLYFNFFSYKDESFFLYLFFSIIYIRYTLIIYN